MVPFLLLLPSLATQCAPETCTGAAQPKCPTASGRVSKPSLGGHRENVYFRNVSPHPAEMSRVSGDGVEVSHGLLLPGMRRATSTVHGDVWRARAVTSGKANGRLLMEHQIGAVQIHACECPQPAFVDCSKAPTIRDGSVVSDPIVFENQAAEPVDLFYFNGDRRTPTPFVPWTTWPPAPCPSPLPSAPLPSATVRAVARETAAPQRRLGRAASRAPAPLVRSLPPPVRRATPPLPMLAIVHTLPAFHTLPTRHV